MVNLLRMTTMEECGASGISQVMVNVGIVAAAIGMVMLVIQNRRLQRKLRQEPRK